MAVREFDGADDTIALTGGSVGALCNGAFSIAALVKPTTISGAKAFIGIQNGATVLLSSLNDGTAGNLSSFSDADTSGAFCGLATTWTIVAMTKPAGTVAARFHLKPLGSGSWTHVGGTGTMANKATTVTRFQLGAGATFGSIGLFKDCRMATAAVFGSELSDAEVESIQTTSGTQNLADLGAVALWDLNQESASTAVVDLVGDFDESARTGTAVVVDDDPSGWTFGLGGGGGLKLRAAGEWVDATRRTRVDGAWV